MTTPQDVPAEAPQDAPREPYSPLPVRITSDGLRHQVLVDGHDVSDQLASAHVHVSAGALPLVLLEAEPGRGLSIEGPALVQLVDREPVAPRVLAWLDAIDPAELDQRILTAPMTQGPGAAVLAVLCELAPDLDKRE